MAAADVPGGGVDRLERAAAMVTDAVALLQQAMKEIRGETKGPDDDGDAAGPPDRKPQQPG